MASELEKDILIQELLISANFSETHRIIRKLSRYSEFTPSQVNDIVTAAISNDQIYWIATDEDVHAFLTSVVKGREEHIDPEDLARIEHFLTKLEPYGDIRF